MERILMQAAIDAAWRSDAPEVRELQQLLFPEGKPTPELFVRRIAAHVAESSPLVSFPRE